MQGRKTAIDVPAGHNEGGASSLCSVNNQTGCRWEYFRNVRLSPPQKPKTVAQAKDYEAKNKAKQAAKFTALSARAQVRAEIEIYICHICHLCMIEHTVSFSGSEDVERMLSKTASDTK